MTPRPGEKKAGNGMRLLGLSFPSEGPFSFSAARICLQSFAILCSARLYAGIFMSGWDVGLKADATKIPELTCGTKSAKLWPQVPHVAARESAPA
jgi:hypothetical protein